MAYENLCMYCFEEMEGQTVCPHCGRDSRAAVPQIQMLPGSLIYHDRFLIGRALGQDATGIVYAAYDTKKENRLRVREYLPRDCAERLNDGAVVPIAGMEDQFEAGIRKLRASVEGVEDPRKRHFFFEENGTAYIAQRKSAASAAARDEEPEDAPEGGGKGRVLLFAGIAVAVLLVAAILLITVFNGALPTNKDITQSPTLDPSQIWIPVTTPTPTPYVAPTFAALVDPELSWMDYTYDGDVEKEYQQAERASRTPTPKPAPTATPRADGARKYSMIDVGSSKGEIRGLQEKLSELGWLESDQVTGKYDSDTRSAVRQFQSYINEKYNPRQKLTVDGIAGPKTQQWLYETDAQKPTPSPTPKVTPKADAGTVDESSPASVVRSMQRKLISLGLLPENAADGKYGATTRTAVRRFQTQVNKLAGYDVLEVTGTMDAQSMAFLDYYAQEWETLRKATAKPTATPKATPKPTATPTTRPLDVLETVIDGNAPKAQIIKVQKLLIDIGMLPKGSADGIYGSATISAVADFQQWVNDQRKEETLPVNGEVDQMTLLYLEYCKDHGMMPYGTPTPKPTRKPTAQPLTPVDVEPEETEEPEEIDEPEEPEEPEESQEISIDADSDPDSIRFVQRMLNAVGALDESGVDGVYGKATVRAVKRFQRWVNSVQGAGTLPEDGKVDNRTRLALEYAYDNDLTIAEVTEAPTEAPTPEPTEAPTPEPTDAPIPRDTEAPEAPEEEEPEEGGEISVGEDSDPDSIRFVQQMLSAVGLFDEDDINGRYDEATTKAVRRFQSWVNDVRGKGTLPVNGKVDDLTRQYLEYAFEHDMRAEADEPIPTEAPTEAPPEEESPFEPLDVAEIGELEIEFDGSKVGDGVVSISEGKVGVRWSVEGDVERYAITVQDSAGETVYSKDPVKDTRFTIDTRKMIPGEVYTLRLGVMPEGGGEADMIWKSVRFTLPAEPEEIEEDSPFEPLDEDEEEDEPFDEPEEERDGEPFEEPDGESELVPETAFAQKPEETLPVVGSVSAPQITIAGEDAGGGAILVEDDRIQVNWTAEGDVDTYYVRIMDSNGNDITEPQYTTQTGFTMRSANMEPGEVYTLTVGAVPVNGTQEDMEISRAQFTRPIPETPEPTEVPTPAPQVAAIGTPVITVGGSAYQQDGISYMTGNSIIVSWNADGDVESYTVYVENQAGESQELGTTTDTSRTVSTKSLPAGIYTVYVGALPRGGGGDDVVWGSTRFGIPAAEAEPEPEIEKEPSYEDEGDAYEDGGDEGEGDAPEEEDAPRSEERAAAVSGPITASSDSDTVYQLQLRLYSLGLLSTDGLESGVLDAKTLQAVAEFQARMNEKYDMSFDVIDPGDPSAVVDADTVSAIFAS